MKPHTPSLRTYQRSKESNLTVAWSSRTLVWLRYTTRPGRVHHLKPSRRTRSLITQSVRQNRVLPHGHADKRRPRCEFPAISRARPGMRAHPRARACAHAYVCPLVHFPWPGVGNYFTPTSCICSERALFNPGSQRTCRIGGHSSGSSPSTRISDLWSLTSDL